MNRITLPTLTWLSLLTTGTAFADCTSEGTLEGARTSYARAQERERAGDTEGAFRGYVGAQQDTCEPNPFQADGARRAAPLGLALGNAAEKKGDFERAFDYYEHGGHYSAADRALVSMTRARPDDVSTFTKAWEVLRFRPTEAFRSNNKVRLSVTGPYQPDAKHLAEVLTLPSKAVERAFQREATLFSEEYLRESVQLAQSMPNDLSDMAAMQRAAQAQGAFLQKWGEDRLEVARNALADIGRWTGALNDEPWRNKVHAQLKQRLNQRLETVRGHSGAPKLLEAAMDYQRRVSEDGAEERTRVAELKAQAASLGDAANAKQRYALAAGYYEVAGQTAKAQAVRDRMQQAAMSRMQPQIDEMKKQAEQLQKSFGDPAQVKAMQEQAEAARRAIQQQQQTDPKARAKKADDLEKELEL
jgi:hypothetical protein